MEDRARARFLVSIDTKPVGAIARLEIWRVILNDSVRLGGVDSFTVDLRDAIANDREIAAALRLMPDSASTTPVAIEIVGEHALVDLGPHVLALNLYADDRWVAGIADWGEVISAVLTSQDLDRLERALDQFGVREFMDSAELEAE